MKFTRRRMLGLTGAVAMLAMPATALAAEPTAETFTLIRAGNATIIKDANDTNVYIRAGSTELMTPGSTARLGALLTAVRAHREEGVYEIRLPAETEGRGEG